MKFKIIKKQDQLESFWTGGVTNQLFICPEYSSLQERNFDFRISSSKVDVEESNFTPFIGYDRFLMILEGEVEITHEGEYSKILKQFEIDHFSGDWKTSSKGKIVDFNLIVRNGIKGSLRYISNNDFRSDKYLTVSTIGYYVISGKMNIVVNQDNYLVSEGELIMMDATDEMSEINGDVEIIEILIG